MAYISARNVSEVGICMRLGLDIYDEIDPIVAAHSYTHARCICSHGYMFSYESELDEHAMQRLGIVTQFNIKCIIFVK